METSIDIYNSVAFKCSKIITEQYSTSFTLGIKTLDPKFHVPIYAIYGFVRSADEIVDTFHSHDKKKLLEEFKHATYQAIDSKISLNPLLHAFQFAFHQYDIGIALVEAFLKSMEMDLYHSTYDSDIYEEYIYGSAEVVGLMCLKVFCEGDEQTFNNLKEPAKKLGAAFQKVNFLRDIKSDYYDRGRTYFPGLNFHRFDESLKSKIEDEIQQDFDAALKGILMLPEGAKQGVYLAYIYYLQLFKKIKNCPAKRIFNERIRVPDNEKLFLLIESYLRQRFNFL